MHRAFLSGISQMQNFVPGAVHQICHHASSLSPFTKFVAMRHASLARSPDCTEIDASLSQTPPTSQILPTSQTPPTSQILPTSQLVSVTSMTERFAELMSERSLRPNLSQSELVEKLQILQAQLVDCSNQGIMKQRLEHATLDLLSQRASAGLQPTKRTLLGSVCNMLRSNITSSSSLSSQEVALRLSRAPYPGFPRLRNLYIWGGVGQGKTMLMDAFFDSCQIKQKTRIHFHEFMMSVQQSLHKVHSQDATTNNIEIPMDALNDDVTEMGFGNNRVTEVGYGNTFRRRSERGVVIGDPLLQVAFSVAKQASLVCLDEFQVVHIADALVLQRLFEGLTHFGCVCVTTSNKAPSELFKGGLNFDRFIPFIESVQNHWDVFQLSTHTDYRQQVHSRPVAASRFFHSPVRSLQSALVQMVRMADGKVEKEGEAHNEQTDSGETELTRRNALSAKKAEALSAKKAEALSAKKAESCEISVAMGRRLKVPFQLNRVCLFFFTDLCGVPIGILDFIALANHFHTVFIYDIPCLSKSFEESSNEIRRFIQLIDVLYEHLVLVVFDAQVPLAKLLGVEATIFDTLRALIHQQTTLNGFIEVLTRKCLEYYERQTAIDAINSSCCPGRRQFSTEANNRLEQFASRQQDSQDRVNALRELLPSLTFKDSQDVVSLIERSLQQQLLDTSEELTEMKTRELFPIGLKAALHSFSTNSDSRQPSALQGFDTPSSNFRTGVSSDAGSCTDCNGVQQNRFALARTVSRIRHMLSDDYFALHCRHWEIST